MAAGTWTIQVERSADAQRVGQRHQIQEEMVIGRASGTSLQIDDPLVSRRHLRIKIEAGQPVCRDLKSSRGTGINDKPLVGDQSLSPGDRIQLGNTVLLVERDGNGTPPPMPSAPVSAVASEQSIDDQGIIRFYEEDAQRFKRRIHEETLARLNVSEIGRGDLEDKQFRARVIAVLDEVLNTHAYQAPPDIEIARLRPLLIDDLLAYGPITPFLADASISEVMVNGPDTIFIERKGMLLPTRCKFSDDAHVMTIIRRIVEPLGRRIDESSPMVDARLPDGSRVNAIIPPLAIDGPSITIRKFSRTRLTGENLVDFGSLTPAMLALLKEAVRSRQNIVISGGTGSGKTTLLNVLSSFIASDERIVTVEDSAELQLDHPNKVRLESRPANLEGKGNVTIRDLVVNCLRMRPDRIIVGECRGREAFDMLQAMNTGHDGSLTTVHANSPRDAIMRLENMVMMAGFELPVQAIREQIASAVDLIVQQTRMQDGSRRITQITEITGREKEVVTMQDIFRFKQSGISRDSGTPRVLGTYEACGNIPNFIDELRAAGDMQVSLDIFQAGR